eukprot:5343962-Prymnesium_polylepis.2
MAEDSASPQVSQEASACDDSCGRGVALPQLTSLPQRLRFRLERASPQFLVGLLEAAINFPASWHETDVWLAVDAHLARYVVLHAPLPGWVADTLQMPDVYWHVFAHLELRHIAAAARVCKAWAASWVDRARGGAILQRD